MKTNTALKIVHPEVLGVIQRVDRPICGISEIIKPIDAPNLLLYVCVVGWDASNPIHRQFRDTFYYKQKYLSVSCHKDLCMYVDSLFFL